MKPLFNHEKLTVYRAALEFSAWCSDVVEDAPKSCTAWGQLDRAAVSIPLNIAEGNGKHTPNDRCKFFDIARGSALECSAALDVLVVRGLLEEDRAAEGKRLLSRIVEMLFGLIRSTSPTRSF